MRPILWTDNACEDFKAIVGWMAAKDPQTAWDFAQGVVADAATLDDALSFASAVEGTSEMTCSSGYYRFIYRQLPDAVQILALVHIERAFPN